MTQTAHTVRPAAIAGYFYPGEPHALRTAVAGYMADAKPAAPASAAPKAVIVPHAGFVYSAPIAAAAYNLLAADAEHITRIVLFGPTHRVYVRGLAAPSVDAFATPLGPVLIDREAIAAVAHMPGVIIRDDVHEQEHCIEVQLPFLQRVAPKAKVAPFAVGDVDPADVMDVMERLWGGPETRIVISSDLSHYLPYAAAQKTDAATAAAIEKLDGAQLGPEDACGCIPIAGLLAAAKRRHMHIRRLDLRNSGDTAGSRDRVVGYGAWAVDG